MHSMYYVKKKEHITVCNEELPSANAPDLSLP
jgi:hypothetical protein